ncbi:hypothetical protein GCM10010919_01680 [Alishewanella longhuensis]|uniref:KfrA N-terminal DNA-binding domain-containing protein n=1 Tax=Alishewanella longhuensis TaxID=1091037 RepID=A0ABQ3KSY6_9ALTE|nr:hypothetical protein [Alishewanella longhuensis]GHG59284.1 hypothetical protein GCM10010919_01680 [Alishewanella longhuensis]
MSQYTDVKRICDDLESSGKAVSLDYLLSKVSDAQTSVVSHYKKWRNEQVQPRQQDNLTGFSDEFIAAFKQEALKQTQQQTEQLNKQLSEAIHAEVKAVEQLQHVQQSLRQVEQRKSELEHNLVAQQQQLAQQAEHFAELTNERNQLQQELQQLQQQLKTQQLSLQQAQQALTAAQAAEQASEQALQLQAAELTKQQEHYAAIEQQHLAGQQQLKQLSEEFEQLRKRATDQQRQYFESNKQIHQQLATYAEQCAELTTERDALQQQLQQRLSVSTGSAEQALQQQLKQLQRENEQLQADLSTQASSNALQTAQLAQAQQQLAQLQQQSVTDSADTETLELAAVKAERDEAIAKMTEQAAQTALLEQELRQFKALLEQPAHEHSDNIEQLRTNIALLKHQSALTANHQAEQRETIKLLREEITQQQEIVQKVQVERYQWAKQKLQLEEQVNFVKSNSAATIERLTRYREQAQERIEQLEQKLRQIQ